MGPRDRALRARARALRRAGRDRPAARVHPPRRARGGRGRPARAAVLDVADAGDEVAQTIVARMGCVLGRQARACAAQLELPLEGTPIVLTGGVFGHPTDRLAARHDGRAAGRGRGPPRPAADRRRAAAGARPARRQRRRRHRRRPASPSSPTEGAPHGRDRPRRREQGLPGRRRRRRRRRPGDRRRRVHGARRARPAAASRRCCG